MPWRWGIGRRRCMGSLDSPVALAAWIIDHDIWTYRQIARVFDGATEGLTRDDILRQHHPLLADRHGGIVGSSVLGEQVRLLHSEGGEDPSRGERFPGGDLPDSAKVGRKRPIPSWSTTSAIRKAPTSPRGSSRRRSWKIFARGSSRCGSSRAQGVVRWMARQARGIRRGPHLTRSECNEPADACRRHRDRHRCLRAESPS